jgi:hypothetical protein
MSAGTMPAAATDKAPIRTLVLQLPRAVNNAAPQDIERFRMTGKLFFYYGFFACSQAHDKGFCRARYPAQFRQRGAVRAVASA